MTGYPTIMTIGEAPPFLRAPFILYGYRVDYSFTDCMASLFAQHNETCNVWTHIIGLILFICLGIYRYYTVLYDTPPTILGSFLAFYCAGCVCMLTSAAYHLFSCMSESWQKWLYRQDMNGIVCMILGCYVPGIVLAFTCQPYLMMIYVTIVSVFGLLVLISNNIDVCLQPSFFTIRISFLVTWAAFAIVPYHHWMTLNTPFQMESLAIPFIATFSLYGMGLVFWLSAFPERFFPGVFDTTINSHGIWHMFVFVAPIVFERGLINCVGYVKQGIWCS